MFARINGTGLRGRLRMAKVTRRQAAGLLGSALVASVAGRSAFATGGRGVVCTQYGRALRGADPVGYFREGRQVAGDDRIATRWRGAIWCFASAENRAAFEADPRAYAPRYGGYCAFGMSLDEALDGDPAAWAIVDGRLYLCNSPALMLRWKQDIPENIARADANWPEMRLRLAG